MSEEFVRFATFLRPACHPEEPAARARPSSAREPAETRTAPEETLRAARIFRAALSDALDVTLRDLLGRIARDVLARELQLASADVCAIARAAVARHRNDGVLAVRAHSSDLAALARCEIAAVADDALAPGDVVLQLRSGTIDVSLAARLDAAVAELCP